ncbi:flagellar hook-associated protein FlgL [Modestobacter versicolor]|uniref:Flagellar hook-associated protein 3 n=1 Tax=Modestobacter versicolor TaxID=429133 RepID=A0A323V9Y6_9ACTN|nr:flagellar hook-associated protein FlgL [Modestobacter versicolor]MBB3676500.1 flagellar hook-associated protein 3 FlgL [Modestobacter versicolor]PZA21652.1 flagellar hook-associated protein 3 [Modestobacter versicolor]
MRITQRSVATTSLQGLNQNLAAISKLQQQLTSGRTINKPSDDPTGTNAAMQTRQEIAGATQHARNISDGLGVLNITDSTLQNMIAQVHTVKDRALTGSNDGALSEAARSAIATEVRGIRESLLGLANTQVQGHPVFGGVTSGTTAYDPATGAYVGFRAPAGPLDTTVMVNRQVAEGDTIRVDITGLEAFGVTSAAGVTPVTRDLFQIVGDIADHVVNDPAKLAADMTALDAALGGMLKAATDIGTRTNRMETAKQVNADLQLTLTSRSADIENVDLAKTIMNLQMQQTGYEAALGATAKAIQPTLLDFLR